MNDLLVALTECAAEFDNEFGTGEPGTSVWGSQLRDLVKKYSSPRTENAPDSATMVVAEELAERKYGHTSWEGRHRRADAGAYSRCSTTERAALWSVAEGVVERLQDAGYIEPVKEGT